MAKGLYQFAEDPQQRPGSAPGPRGKGAHLGGQSRLRRLRVCECARVRVCACGGHVQQSAGPVQCIARGWDERTLTFRSVSGGVGAPALRGSVLHIHTVGRGEGSSPPHCSTVTDITAPVSHHDLVQGPREGEGPPHAPSTCQQLRGNRPTAHRPAAASASDPCRDHGATRSHQPFCRPAAWGQAVCLALHPMQQGPPGTQGAG